MVFHDPSLAPYRGKEPFIFLSYSHRNAEQAAQIIHRLNQLSFRVWYDEGLIPGKEWDENIAHIIMGCSYFVALISKEYLASSNCRDELNFARDKDKPMLLIYLEDVTLPAGMELRLGRLFAIHRNRITDESLFYTRFFDAEGIERCCAQVLLRPAVPVDEYHGIGDAAGGHRRAGGVGVRALRYAVNRDLARVCGEYG